MSKIYELPLSFRLVKKYIRFTFKRFYSEFIVLGKENIPSEGQVIFAPNHLNALMDALAQLAGQRGCCKLTLEVLSENRAAQGAYRKAGFAPYSLDEATGLAQFWQKYL